MKDRFKGALSGAGFYVTLSICLLAAAAGGYFLLLDNPAPREEEPAQESAAPAALPAQPQPEEEAAAEPEEPEEVQTPVIAMPEDPVTVDDTVPVVAEAPHLVVSPLQGEVVSAFSVDQLMYNETLDDWRTHDGIDIAAQTGTHVLSASAGTVLAVEDDPLMGTTVVIEHAGGYQTTYANLQAQPTVAEGDTVSAGQIIGSVGTTAAAESASGPHLHFAVTCDGDAVDPQTFLDS